MQLVFVSGLAKCAGLGCTFVPVNAIAFSDVPRRCLMQPDCVAGSPGGTGIRNAEVGRDTPIILWRHDFALLMIVAPGSIAPSLLVRSRRRAAGTEANIAVALRNLPDRPRVDVESSDLEVEAGGESSNLRLPAVKRKPVGLFDSKAYYHH